MGSIALSHKTLDLEPQSAFPRGANAPVSSRSRRLVFGLVDSRRGQLCMSRRPNRKGPTAGFNEFWFLAPFGGWSNDPRRPVGLLSDKTETLSNAQRTERSRVCATGKARHQSSRNSNSHFGILSLRRWFGPLRHTTR